MVITLSESDNWEREKNMAEGDSLRESVCVNLSPLQTKSVPLHSQFFQIFLIVSLRSDLLKHAYHQESTKKV
jgi:hypothetical protein